MTYEKESRDYYKEELTRKLVFELFLYKKYFENNNESMSEIFKSCLDNWVLNEKEVKKIIDNARSQLKNICGLDIVSDEPLVFKKIDIS
jgi:hypothetical protein